MSLSLIRVRFEPTNCVVVPSDIRDLSAWMDTALPEHAARAKTTNQTPATAPANPFPQMAETNDPICLEQFEAERLICFFRWMKRHVPFPAELQSEPEAAAATLTAMTDALEQMTKDEKPINIVFG